MIVHCGIFFIFPGRPMSIQVLGSGAGAAQGGGGGGGGGRQQQPQRGRQQSTG